MQVDVTLSDGTFARAAVPSGASTGKPLFFYYYPIIFNNFLVFFWGVLLDVFMFITVHSFAIFLVKIQALVDTSPKYVFLIYFAFD